MREITHIIIHHSLTADSHTLSWDNIRKYHTEHNQWSDIGYHYGIELVDDGYEILVGRPLHRSGAHCSGQRNTDSIGICVVGNYDVMKPPRGAMQKLFSLCKDLMEIFSIPAENVRGHCDYSTKSCPGSMFDMTGFRRLLKC